MSSELADVGFFVSHDELVEDIIDAYFTKEPLYIWGRTGIGKSLTVKKAAKILAEKFGRKLSESVNDIDDKHFVLLDRRLAYRNPTDLVGVLYKDNGVSKWHYPDWLVKLSKQREEKEGIKIRGMIFLDELNLAPPLVQNAAYSLVLDRKIEDLELADGVVVIAAGNVADDRAYTFDLSDPLKTRFTHVTLKTPVFKDEVNREGWFYWASENGIDGRILAFLNFQPDQLFCYVEGDKTFPTPRGWEKASNLMKGKSNDKAWRAVAKACGYAAGLQFKQFISLSRNLDLEEILNNPEKFIELPMDVKFSVIGSLTHLYTQKPERYAERMLKMAAHLFSGIYDDDKLEKYVELAEKNDESARKEMAKMVGTREAELAALTLTNMKAANKEVFKRTIESSKYASAVTDLVFFLI